MEVRCDVEKTIFTKDGRSAWGVLATCGRCDRVTSSMGTSEKSVLRCLAMMRDGCPKEERNYYILNEQEG